MARRTQKQIENDFKKARNKMNARLRKISKVTGIKREVLLESLDITSTSIKANRKNMRAMTIRMENISKADYRPLKILTPQEGIQIPRAVDRMIKAKEAAMNKEAKKAQKKGINIPTVDYSSSYIDQKEMAQTAMDLIGTTPSSYVDAMLLKGKDEIESFIAHWTLSRNPHISNLAHDLYKYITSISQIQFAQMYEAGKIPQFISFDMLYNAAVGAMEEMLANLLEWKEEGYGQYSA